MERMDEEQRHALEALYARVEDRASGITRTQAAWPCRRGCDHCCRTLSAPLPLTDLEWRYLWEGFQRLPAEMQAQVRAQVAELERGGEPPHYTCPLLDGASGDCRVYAHRPLACRSYGFAIARDGGRWCDFIDDLLTRQGDDGIAWASQEVLDDAVSQLGGPVSSLFEWFAAHPASPPERD